MASKIKTFDFSQPSTLTTTDKAIYPWDQWFDGDLWELTYGEDFETHPLMMERIIRTRATGRGAKVRLRHVPMNDDPWGKIIVQRTDIKGPAELKSEARKAKSAATRAANGHAKDINGAPVKATKATNGKKMVAKKAVPAKRVGVKRQLATVS